MVLGSHRPRQAANNASLECEFVHVLEQVPSQVDLSILNHSLYRDAVEPRPNGAVVVRLVLWVLLQGEVIGMKERVVRIERRHSPRKNQGLPTLAQGWGRDLLVPNEIQRKEHVRAQSEVGFVFGGKMIG